MTDRGQWNLISGATLQVRLPTYLQHAFERADLGKLIRSCCGKLGSDGRGRNQSSGQGYIVEKYRQDHLGKHDDYAKMKDSVRESQGRS
jgi:hypothetical protein